VSRINDKEMIYMEGGSRVHTRRIDYRLAIQQIVKDRIIELGCGKFTPPEIEKNLVRIASLGKHVELGALKVLAETKDQKIATMAAALLLKLDADMGEIVVDECLSLMNKPGVSDVAKMQILRLLTAKGLDVGEMMSPTYFQDATKLAHESLLHLLEELEQNPSILGNVLEDFAEAPPEMQYAYVQDLVMTQDPRVVPLLEALARGDDEVLASEAVRGLGALAEPTALGALQGLAVKVQEPFLATLVEREARRLQFKGVSAESLPPFVLGTVFQVLVTGLDGKGCRIVWVSRFMKGSRGRLMAVSFLLSTEEGVKDCYGSVQLNRQESTSMLKGLREKYPSVEGDLIYASDLVRDALQRNRQGGNPLPPQWAFWHQVLQPIPMTPKPYDFPLADDVGGGDAPQATGILAIEELAEWYEEDPLVYDAAEELLKAGKRFRSIKGKKKAADEIMCRVATALFAPRLGEIVRRLDFTAEFLRRRGKVDSAEKLAEISRALRLGQPPEENPFLRNLLTLSVRVAEHNLRAGFDLRRHPDRNE